MREMTIEERIVARLAHGPQTNAELREAFGLPAKIRRRYPRELTKALQSLRMHAYIVAEGRRKWRLTERLYRRNEEAMLVLDMIRRQKDSLERFVEAFDQWASSGDFDAPLLAAMVKARKALMRETGR